MRTTPLETEADSKDLCTNTATKKAPLVIEIVGPAGAGKTTLLCALCERSKTIRPGIGIHRARHLLTLIGNVLYWQPTFIPYSSQRRWLSWGEIRSMSYLHGWQRILRHPTSNDGRVVVFDHGPIFRLVQLREFGPESTKSHRYGRWWSSMLKRWAHTLNIIVWLDTREPVLLERLQTRTKGHHRIKRLSEDESYEFLARYRSAYKGIITKLTGDGCQTLLYFDTSKHSTEQIADKVLAACNLVGREI